MPQFLKFRLYLILIFFGFIVTVNGQTSKLDSLNNLIQVKKGSEQLDLIIEAGKEYLYVSPQKAVEYGEKALALGKALNDFSHDGMANLLVGAGYLFNGDFEKGKEFTDRGLKIARANKNADEECSGLNSLAVFYMNTGDYKQATDLFHETIDKALASNLVERAATATFNLGAIYTNQGKLAEGLNAFQEALKYFTSVGNKKLIARTLMNIAVNYHSWSNYDRALEYYQKADNYFKEINDRSGRVASLNNIGEVHKDRGRYKEAVDFYKHSLDLSIEIEAKLNEAVAYIGLAEAYLNLGELNKSKELALQSLSIFETMVMLEGISRSKLVLSDLSFRSGDLNEAMKLAIESETLAEKAGITDILVQTTELLSKIKRQSGDYKQAYLFLLKNNALKDSIYNDRQIKRLGALQSELDLKLKENEIVLLQKENEIKDLQLKKQHIRTQYLISGIIALVLFLVFVLYWSRERKKANLLLDERNKQISEQHLELLQVDETRKRFLSIIGHDLRSPIGAFSEMLGQIVDSPRFFTEEAKTQILKELRREADSTFYLLDNLLSWTRSQKGNIEYKPELISLKSAINSNILLNSRFSENKKIQLRAEGEYDFMVFADVNMLNLIIRNLVSNAIKFSYSGGNVRIFAADEGNQVKISIADQGVGIDEENIPKLFDVHNQYSTYGTAHEKGSGLGLILCHEFIKKSGGEIVIQSKKDVGTTISFTLPKSGKS